MLKSFIFVSVVAISCLEGAGSSVCPESKKQHPGDCRLFYKCVPLPESAQAYAWVPSRCTAGLVYEPKLQRCVFPGEAERDCESSDEDFDETWFYSLKGGASAEGAMKMTDYPATSTVQSGIYMSGFNDDDKSTRINSISSTERNKDATSVKTTPVSAVNNPALDPIGTQMHRLTQLISSLKATSVHNNNPDPGPTRRPPVPVGYSALPKPALDLSFPFKQETPHFPVHELNLLPAQIYKITAQLISHTPYPNIQTNLDLPNPQTKHSDYHRSPDEVVTDLYRKYLANNTFLKDGEFSKISHRFSEIPLQCHPGDRLAHPYDCAKYRICIKNSSGLATLTFACPPNTAFSGAKKMCDEAEFKQCLGKIYGNEWRNNCEEGGRMPDALYKNYYIVCVEENGALKEHRVKCPGSLEYCHRNRLCQLRENCSH